MREAAKRERSREKRGEEGRGKEEENQGKCGIVLTRGQVRLRKRMSSAVQDGEHDYRGLLTRDAIDNFRGTHVGSTMGKVRRGIQREGGQ
jgi:hypothetical protein